MANTKNLPRPQRKAARRRARKSLKALLRTLNRKQRAKLRAEPVGIKKFLAQQD